jgi:hypothetical protein
MTENNKPENFRRLVSMTGGNPYDKVFQSDKLREEVIKESKTVYWNKYWTEVISRIIDLTIQKARENLLDEIVVELEQISDRKMDLIEEMIHKFRNTKSKEGT